jgi:2-polyprenyl-6-methoxyphenol hydroxylase-like FAD-dependent oxidoreductase
MSLMTTAPATPKSQPSIAICGGGIGGLATALALRNKGFRATVFERSDADRLRSEGLFLTLAPNGINALRALGLAKTVLAAGLMTRGLAVYNERGRLLTIVDYASHAQTFGAASVTIQRGALAGILLDTAIKAGIEIRDATAVETVRETENGVELVAEGKTEHFDIILACDGIRSRIRQQIFPDLPQPAYTGQIGTGGVTDEPQIAPTDGLMRMTFGRKAFFGYIKAPGQPVHWFNNYPAPENDTGPVEDAAQFGAKLRDMHADDPLDNLAILEAAGPVARSYPVYDMPALARWHTDHVLLMGDAAHAVAPHSGQGASMAIEDAVVLAACLAAESKVGDAFARFVALRRDRVAKAIQLGRATGSQKLAQGWLQLKIRDLILPIVMPMAARMQSALFAFRIDQDPLAMPRQ